MLTIKPIGSTADEVNYYAHLGKAENHDYYSEVGSRPGEWFGEGAQLLGLSGEVDPDAFHNLLEGLSTDGKKALVQIRNGNKIRRRAGFDLTFSLVKSFSGAWSFASPNKRKQLEAVARKAVSHTMEVVQELCGVTRRGKDGLVTEAAKLVGAVFHHDTSRNVPGEVPDPNVHFHVVLANLVVREDGTTGALDARALFQRRMKMALGALFRAEVSRLLHEELGISTYRPKRERKDELASWFEIEGVPQKLCEAMSKRRQQIEKRLRELGLTGAKAAEQAALRTREGKERYTWRQLEAAWERLGAEHQFGREEVAALFQTVIEQQSDLQRASHGALQRAIASLEEQKARFTYNELLERTAIEAQARGIGIQEVLSEVREATLQSSELIRLEAEKGVPAYTTQSMLELERRLLETARKLHNRSGHSVPALDVERVIASHQTLRQEQQQAIRAISSGNDLTVVTGVAGSGKTFMLKVCREVLEAAGYGLLGTALASKATKGLEKESGIRSQHIHQLLYAIERGRVKLTTNTVLVVDEAGMVGTRMMERLSTVIAASGGKLVLVGDHKQLQAIEAGAPLRYLGEQLGTIEMNTNARQREPWAREMVTQLREGKAEQALLKLHERGQLHIAPGREAAMTKLVADWEQLVFDKGEKVAETLVFAGMNREVRELNERIQQVLKREGQLGEYSVELGVYHYHLGDQVVFTRNHKLLNLRNGTLGEVVGARDKKLWVLTEDGIEVELNADKFSDIALSYSMSVHKGQGVTCENALLMTGDSMTDQEFAYTAATRPRGKTLVYADELSVAGIGELAARMNTSRQKEMAHEHRLEIE